MKKYHNYEMNQIKGKLLCFLIFEAFIQIFEIIIMYFVVSYIKHENKSQIKNTKPIYYYIFLCYIGSGFYVVLQGMGLVFVKSTKDPLERISKIGYL